MARLDRLTDHAEANRAAWDDIADGYQRDHGGQLDAAGGAAWGVWQVPESELEVLGDVAGRDVLELGCGAAQWSIALAQRGARPTALDLSARQLSHAREAMGRAGVDFPVLEASAESVPLPDGSFDIAFCDHGAMAFADPQLTVPEVARLLRPGGLLAFSMITPIIDLCWPGDVEVPGERLLRDYYDLRANVYEGMTHFQLPYGSWIRLFRAHRFAIEDLIEIRPSAEATSTYWSGEAHREWARRWPAEHIWKVRRG